ncbi:MAG: Bcr/CflA family drug resistance efflux transporter, partial [Prevotella sp.]|nr:Bcr/CflA family drug resistance efflux transporter [Prevotella sp.]
FGLTPMEYSLCFAGNAVGLVLGSSIVMKIKDLEAATMWSTIVLMSMAILVGCALFLAWPFSVFEVFLFLMLFCVGMLTPATVTIALRSVKENRGMASALLGAVPFLLGGMVAPLTGIGNIVHSTSLSILACAFICICLWGISYRWRMGLCTKE